MAGNMARRLNTIIVVPHSKAKFIKFSYTTRSLLVACCGVLVSLALSLIAIFYTGSAVGRRAEVSRLNKENHELTAVNQQLEQEMSEVQGRLDEFEERTARLALAAGMEAEEVDLDERGSQSQRIGSGGLYARLPDSPEHLRQQGTRISSLLDRVELQLGDQEELLACTPTIAPVLGLLTDGYGRRKDPFTGRQAFHPGLDISARRKTSVVAPANGVVVYAGRNGGLGKVVRLSHGFGYTTVYGHLHTIVVEPGDEIRRGQEIGLLGNTGRSTGPHLHYEVRVDGKAVNPLYYVLNAY
jgi:murein DD-endopeptidase MepM/ murein hydrolase activator NlpD